MAFAVTITKGPGAVNSDKHVVQRTSATGASGVIASGTFSGRATNGVRLQYRIVEDGGSVEFLTWADAEVFAAPGDVSGSWKLRVDSELALDTVWWNWDFRMLDKAGAVVESDLAHTEKWGVGLVYLFIGQSNMEFFYLQGDTSPGTADGKLGWAMTANGVDVPWADMVTMDDHDIHLVAAAASTWTESTKTITATGAFAAYSHTASDDIYLFGIGVTPGLYEIASRTSDHAIVLSTSCSAAGVDLGAVINSNPRSGGVVNALNAVQAGVTTDSAPGRFGDIPIGAIGMAVSGSMIVPGANPDAGFESFIWTDVDGAAGIFQKAIKRVVALTGGNVIEAVVFQQGEAEARAANTGGNIGLKGAYIAGLKTFHEGLKKYLKGPAGAEVKLILSGPGRNIELASSIALAPSTYSASINEAIVEYAIQEDLGFVYTADAELTAVAPLGLHWTKAYQETWGTRLGVVLQEVTGIVAAAVKSKRGPYISNAWCGWEGPIPMAGAVSKANAAVFTTPFSHGRDGATFTVEILNFSGGSVGVNGIRTATLLSATTFSVAVDTSGATGTYVNGTIEFLDGKTNKKVIKLEITHEKGTALALGDDGSIMCFTVEDEAGPLFVNNVALIAGGDFMVLSLKRDTSKTKFAAQDPYDAPDRLAGNYALVKYLDWPTLPNNATGDREFHIKDNAATPMFLLPTFGFVAPGHSSLRDLPENEVLQLSAAVTSVASIGSKEIELDSQDTPWLYIFGGATRMFRPGERYMIQAIGGVYIGEGTIESVLVYVDAATEIELTLSHDMTGQLPVATNFLTVPYNTETAGGILAGPQSVDSFGV